MIFLCGMSKLFSCFFIFSSYFFLGSLIFFLRFFFLRSFFSFERFKCWRRRHKKYYICTVYSIFLWSANMAEMIQALFFTFFFLYSCSMFSWIIHHKAPILSIHGGLFVVKNLFQEPLKIWQSIAHDGACMTLTEVSEKSYSFFAMEETLRVTNFGTKSVWDLFNVEYALRMWDFLDGHMVSGHIDTIGHVVELTKNEDESLILRVQIDAMESKFLIKKWSIALNGVSLTIVDITTDTVTVSLIPLTQDWTNLGMLQLGDTINIEYDMMAKYIANMIP